MLAPKPSTLFGLRIFGIIVAALPVDAEIEYVLLILTLIYNNLSNNKSITNDFRKDILKFIKMNMSN